jgi:hypothetical protein
MTLPTARARVAATEGSGTASCTGARGETHVLAGFAFFCSRALRID